MIERILKQARNPALWLSFGKDSLLLLKLAREAGFNGPCYYFGDKLSTLATKTIIDNDLTVYSWPALNRYAVPDGKEWAQVDEYLVGSALIPVVSPIRQGGNCEHMQFTQRFSKLVHYPHDITLTGYKQSDRAMGMKFSREMDIGVTRLVHPLYDWTDDEVIDTLGFTPPEDNEIEYCEDCLRLLEATDKDAALARFRSRFNFN